MGRFVRSGLVRAILTVLSWILVLLMAFIYFRALMKGHIWLD
jgi:predicted RND superfamily exporter protein